MSVTELQVLNLADDIGGVELREMVQEAVDEYGLRSGRVLLLGRLDGIGMSDEPSDAEVMASWYDRLGFTPAERSQIRQSAASDE
jgi:hypothetical protein